MIQQAPATVMALFQIVADQPFEVLELAVGDEDRRQGALSLVTDVEKLDAGPLAGQRFECQLDIGEALELYLQAESFFDTRRFLCFPCCFELRLQGLDLPHQRRAVLLPVTIRRH